MTKMKRSYVSFVILQPHSLPITLLNLTETEKVIYLICKQMNRVFNFKAECHHETDHKSYDR